MAPLIKSTSKFLISERAKEIVIMLISWLCMALFLYTAYAKIIGHDRFLNGLSNVHIISGAAVFISYTVPVVEVVVAILLLIPQTLKPGLYSFIVVMAIFTAYVAGIMVLENKLPCRCGGAIEKLSWSQHLWFNLAFILIAVLALQLIKQLSTSFKKLT